MFSALYLTLLLWFKYISALAIPDHGLLSTPHHRICGRCGTKKHKLAMTEKRILIMSVCCYSHGRPVIIAAALVFRAGAIKAGIHFYL